ncbi:MAG: polyphosphate kinase, partial [Pseudomonadota bacterium]
GRVLVERVEGYCDATAWQRAYDEINGFEKTLIDNGTRIIKFFLHVNVDEQAQRFKDRLLVPHKRWKITPDDFRNREKRGQYVAAIEEMLAKTHKRGAPWVIIPAQQKRFARISILRAVLRWMDRFGLQLEQPLDPQMQAYLDRL